jgi:ArsR family transcriptional regulator
MAQTLSLERMHAAAGRACRLMKTLANPDRLMLLCQLAQREMSVGELEASLGIPQPTLSQQLCVLREDGLVDTRREGKYIYYRVRNDAALAVLHTLYRQFCKPEGK